MDPVPDYWFVRDDGFTIGAPKQFVDAAYKLWKDDWEYVYDINKEKLLPIEEYLK